MPDLTAMLLRSSLGATSAKGDRCGGCQRMPLAGETLHELESGHQLCQLCFAALPDSRRLAVRSNRVRASERPLAVQPRAA
jgi:hypothetical protein